MNTFSNVLCETTHAELSKALLHQVTICYGSAWAVMGRFVSTQAFYDADSKVILDVTSVTVPVLRSNLLLITFGSTRKQQNSLCFYPARSKACIGIPQVLLLYRLSCTTCDEENEYAFCSTWNAHCSLIEPNREWTAGAQGIQPMVRYATLKNNRMSVLAALSLSEAGLILKLYLQ